MSAGTVVLSGTPRDLVKSSFTRTKGDKAGEVVDTLGFKMDHPGTALGWPVKCETQNTQVMEAVERAASEGLRVEVIAQLYVIRKEDPKDDWVKAQVKAVLF